MEINMKEINKKLFYGDHITDEELIAAQKNYQQLLDSLKAVENPDYKVFFTDVVNKLNTIDSYIRARKLSGG